MLNKKNPRKGAYFQKVRQKNLENKRNCLNPKSKILQTRQIWVKKGRIKMSCGPQRF